MSCSCLARLQKTCAVTLGEPKLATHGLADTLLAAVEGKSNRGNRQLGKFAQAFAYLHFPGTDGFTTRDHGTRSFRLCLGSGAGEVQSVASQKTATV